MHEVIERFALGGEYTGEVIPDHDPINPREYETLGKLHLLHRRYNFVDDGAPGKDAVICLPVRGYDHSGFCMTADPAKAGGYPFNCPWDSGQLGVVYANRADILRFYVRKRLTKALLEQVQRVLIREVEEYNAYTNGDGYGYRVRTPTGGEFTCCYGYYSAQSAKEACLAAHDWSLDGSTAQVR